MPSLYRVASIMSAHSRVVYLRCRQDGWLCYMRPHNQRARLCKLVAVCYPVKLLQHVNHLEDASHIDADLRISTPGCQHKVGKQPNVELQSVHRHS